MTGKTYDRLKWVALVLMPALASLYFALGELWHFPNVQQIVATITILDTFLGLLLGKSSKNFQDNMADSKYMGEINIVQDYDGTPTRMQVEPKDKKPIFEEGKLVQFRVKRSSLE